MLFVSERTSWVVLLPGLLVGGAGWGAVNPIAAEGALSSVPAEHSGMASGINNTFRQVGIATGIAALGAIFQSSLATQLAPKLAGTPFAAHIHQIAHAVAAVGAREVVGRVPAPRRAETTLVIHSAFAHSMNDILLVAGLVALTTAVLALVLIRGRDFVVSGAREPEPEPARTTA